MVFLQAALFVVFCWGVPNTIPNCNEDKKEKLKWIYDQIYRMLREGRWQDLFWFIVGLPGKGIPRGGNGNGSWIDVIDFPYMGILTVLLEASFTIYGWQFNVLKTLRLPALIYFVYWATHCKIKRFGGITLWEKCTTTLEGNIFMLGSIFGAGPTYLAKKYVAYLLSTKIAPNCLIINHLVPLCFPPLVLGVWGYYCLSEEHTDEGNMTKNAPITEDINNITQKIGLGQVAKTPENAKYIKYTDAKYIKDNGKKIGLYIAGLILLVTVLISIIASIFSYSSGKPRRRKK